MAVIISHRFSTVPAWPTASSCRRGRVVEECSHDTLVARGGLYAELFSLQAEGYR